jgi:hypothetical protein
MNFTDVFLAFPDDGAHLDDLRTGAEDDCNLHNTISITKPFHNFTQLSLELRLWIIANVPGF